MDVSSVLFLDCMHFSSKIQFDRDNKHIEVCGQSEKDKDKTYCLNGKVCCYL